MNHSASSPFTDPFSAVYKARPGELPSFFSIEDYRIHKDKRGQDGQVDYPEPAAAHSSSDLDHPTKPCDSFSPLLAGESDRGIRKRILSNPENFFAFPSTHKATEPCPSPPSKKTETSFLLQDSALDDPRHEDDDSLSFSSLDSIDENAQEEEDDDYKGRLSPLQVVGRARADTIQFNPLERSFMPTRSGIFFSPPKNLGNIETSQQTQHQSRDADWLAEKIESDLQADSRDRFFAAFYRAIIHGNPSIDLDNQNISLVPNLSRLLDESRRRIGSSHIKTSAQMMSLIEKMVDRPTETCCGKSSPRQAMTRSKSAPEVTFSAPPVSLFLSNNFLNSRTSAIQRICHLQGLQHLSLRSNLLTTIPDELGDLKNLQYLNLANNRLTFLPASILNLANCQMVLNGNPWLRVPLKSSPSSLSNEFSFLSSGPSLHQDRVKFTWISKRDKVFRYSPSGIISDALDPSQPSVPTLSESSIRKICITKDSNTGKETIIGGYQDRIRKLTECKMYDQTSLSSSFREIMLPERIKKILLNPHKYFYRCDLCDHKLILKRFEARCEAITPPDLVEDLLAFMNQAHFFQFRKLSRHESDPSAGDGHRNRQGRDGANRTNEELDHDDDESDLELIPIRWKACSLSCCLKNLIQS